jgi:hypothetical protein
MLDRIDAAAPMKTTARATRPTKRRPLSLLWTGVETAQAGRRFVLLSSSAVAAAAAAPPASRDDAREGEQAEK